MLTKEVRPGMVVGVGNTGNRVKARVLHITRGAHRRREWLVVEVLQRYGEWPYRQLHFDDAASGKKRALCKAKHAYPWSEVYERREAQIAAEREAAR